ncbi:hypothetical protein Tco_0500393 [Tanacetum coccineum]
MASHRLNPLYAIKECMTCGSLYTRECCSIGSLGNKILVPEPESSPCCAKCGTPVDGPYCRGCALLRNNFKEDLLTYCGDDDGSGSADGRGGVVLLRRRRPEVGQKKGDEMEMVVRWCSSVGEGDEVAEMVAAVVAWCSVGDDSGCEMKVEVVAGKWPDSGDGA